MCGHSIGGHSVKGFTIIELMVVVAIIGAMIAMVSPAIGSAMADGRAADAAVDVVRLAGAARSAANSTGLAHVVVYDGFSRSGIAQGNIVGRMRLYRDADQNLTTCNPANRWNFGDLTAVDEVNLANYNIANSSHWISLKPVNIDNSDINSSSVINQICFQPDGRMLIRHVTNVSAVSATLFGDSVGGASHALYAVFHTLRGAAAGVPRQVVFTFGGNARIRR
jgi:prepilin-type N-terminal cleavage/methylation domain-containing protein